MRKRRMKVFYNQVSPTCWAIILVLGFFTFNVEAQLVQTLFQKVEPSVVKVKCPDTGNTATGFIWNRSNNVVSALHVVDNSKNIQVYFPSTQITRQASVESVLPYADLVLLSVADAPKSPTLPHTTQTVRENEEVHALGFPLNVTAINSFTFKLRYGGRRLSDNVSENVVKNLHKHGYPDPNLEIVKLGQESLLPGLSGAPIVNGQGQVVAIGSGGLEQGAINISWGIPASHLDKLLRSSSARLPGASRTRELFAAEQKQDIGKTVSSGTIKLIKVKTRSFRELAGSADDQLHLDQLSSPVFYQYDEKSFNYDIYQDVNSGATIAVPQGAEIIPREELWTVTLPQPKYGLVAGQPRVEMKLKIIKMNSPLDGEYQANIFHEDIRRRYSPIEWQQDPEWSYSTTLWRYDGLSVRRNAAIGFMYNGRSFIHNKYLYETLASKDKTFIGIIAINNEFSSQAFHKENLCGLKNMREIPLERRSPECSLLYESRRIWAQAMLGVQMTSFAF